ncbi:hypothetical protein OROMI_019066 [Orobanche minor]
MWIFGIKGKSGFSGSSTAEQVTKGIDGTGLVAIVTGLQMSPADVRASNGIGKETTRVLALRGVHVILGVRNVKAGERVTDEIRQKIPAAKLNVMEIDLNSQASIRKFATEFIDTRLPLNILVNNAGIMSPPFTLSKDNIEQQFAVNHLGPFLLTNLLLDTMKRTARECGIQARIVNVGSELHRYGYKQGILFDKINDSARDTGAIFLWLRLSDKLKQNVVKISRKLNLKRLFASSTNGALIRRYFVDELPAASPWATPVKSLSQSGENLSDEDRLYNSTRDNVFVNIVASIQYCALSERSMMRFNDSQIQGRRFRLEEGANVTANSLHPGVIATNITQNSGLLGCLFGCSDLFLKNVSQGAATSCYLSLSPKVNGVSGEYFEDSNIAKASSTARDRELAKKLWGFSLTLTEKK